MFDLQSCLLPGVAARWVCGAVKAPLRGCSIIKCKWCELEICNQGKSEGVL
jgi:hypothetical protein